MGWVAIISVIFLAPNTYFVYHSFSVFTSPWREIASAGVSLIVAASILIYTLRKNFRVAKYYTIFEVSISAYYYINTIGWDWGLIPALGFTLILPISVYYYSREFDSEEGISWEKNYHELNKCFGESAQDYYKLYDENKALSLEFDVLKISYNELNNESNSILNKLYESQQECAHWVSEYERACTGWSADVGIRDERIEELEGSIEAYESHINEILQPCIDRLKQEIKVLNEKREADELLNRGSKTDSVKIGDWDMNSKPVEKFEKIVGKGVVDAAKTIEESEGVTPIEPTLKSKKPAPIKREKTRVQKSTE